MRMSQRTIIDQLRQELGSSEETEHLLDWLQDSWETLEILQERFGESRAFQIYTASPYYFPIEEPPAASISLETAYPIALKTIEELEERYHHVS